MKGTPDFVSVELSEAGVELVGKDGSLQVANAHFAYRFAPGVPVRVLTSEWRRVLSLETWCDQAIFQVAAESNEPAAVEQSVSVEEK